MMITVRSRFLLTAFIATACTAIAGAGTVAASVHTEAARTSAAPTGTEDAGGNVQRADAGRDAQRAGDGGYWTRYRMEHAVPMGSTSSSPTDGSARTAGGAVAENTGKVFFTLDGTDYVCSGAALAGPASHSAGNGVVVTAAHCVSDGYGSWATHWTFVPGYAAGDAPYGSYTSHKYYVSKLWNGGENETYDIAFVSMPGLTRGLPVVFGSAPRSVYVFGYPADPPYDGDYLQYCSGTAQADTEDPGADNGIRCAMTAGDSGGPWLRGFSPATGTGTVIAVSTFKYSDNDVILYGATLGKTARSLYLKAWRG